MKQKILYLLAWLAPVGMLLTSCQDVDEPYNNIPELGNMSVALDEDNTAHATLYYYSSDRYWGSYFLVSRWPDMGDPIRIDADYYTAQRYYNNYFYANVYDLEADTKYYAQYHRVLDHGDIASPVREFTTYRYAATPVTVIVEANDDYAEAGFFVTETDGTQRANNALYYPTTDWRTYSTKIKVMDEADVYVYKPYKAGSFTYENVPISYSDNFFEYGHTKASPWESYPVCNMTYLNNYNVRLNVRAQATDDAVSKKYIRRLEIANAGTSDAISTSATFNLATGVMTPDKNSAAVWPATTNIQLNSEKATMVNFYSIIPTSFSEGQVQLNVQVSDEKNLTVNQPVPLGGANWERGNTYTYDVIVYYTRNDIQIVVSDVTVTPWAGNSSETIDIYD